MTIQADPWNVSEYIDRLPDPTGRYDYWPWPGVKFLNEDRTVRLESSWWKKATRTGWTS